MNIFVGNLSFEATEQDVLKLFQQFGEVLSITILMDKNGKKSRGFGFLEMADDEKAKAAIAALEGSEFMGRNINVSPARPKPQEKPRSDKQEARAQERLARQERIDRRAAAKEDTFTPKPHATERPSRIKNGRRSRSFMRRTGGYQAQAPGQPRPQAPGPAARWHQRNERPVREEASRPWGREQETGGRAEAHRGASDSAGGEVVHVRRNLKPWQKRKSYMSKPHAEAKPWRKHDGASKPAWQKDAPRPWKKPEGEARPWKKPEGAARPWKKPAGGAKPWQKKKPGGFKR